MNILDKTDEIVFCGIWGNGGDDSAFAAAKALNWGYQNVIHFRGFRNWKEAGYPVETVK